MDYKIIEDKVSEDLGFNYKDYIIKPETINKEIDDFVTGRIAQGFASGITELDNHFLCKKNEFYLLTGKKGDGKTTIHQCLEIMYSMVNNLIWVVAFQENSEWSMKVNYMAYLLGRFPKDVYNEDRALYNRASEWIDKHFYFIEVEDIKTATEVTKGIIKSGIDVHGLVLDPVNSFSFGWQDTGNDYSDGKVAGVKMLRFTKKYCSIHASQHPTVSAQRSREDVTSYSGEGGWYLNKASYTYYINRRGGNENELSVDNVRNKQTGGNTTEIENPVVIYWHPTKIDIGYRRDTERQLDVIGQIRREYNPLKENFKNKPIAVKEVLPNLSPENAFDLGNDEIDEIPF
jgi:energy-coupling factor transporter ATP-binding protein EcfA2